MPRNQYPLDDHCAPDELLLDPGSSPEWHERRANPLSTLLHEIWHGCWRKDSWPARARLRLLMVFLVAGACSWAGIALSRQSEGVATIWLSNGLIFGLLITQPRRRWLAYFAAGLLADTLADMLYGDAFRIAIGVSLANSVEVVSSTLLLTLWFGSPLDLSKRRPLIGFLLTAVLGATALTSALGASWTLLFVPAGPWLPLFRTWYLGDMLGMAILAPLIIILQRPTFFAMLQRRHLPHTSLVLAAPLIVTVLVFTHNSDPLIFFMFPMLLLVAFRLGFPGTVLNIVLMTGLAIGFTVKGHGPLMLIQGPHMLLHRIVVAQIFVAVAIFTMFPVAALLEERQTLETSLAESESRYRGLAHSDELTGLFNRRAFNLSLERAWNHAAALEHSLGLLLIDADLFKQYNDVFGHLDGDACLRCLASVIAEVSEGEDGIAARYGGEEFAVVLPGAELETACSLAEQIRAAIAEKRVRHPSAPAGFQTVSIGVAALCPAHQQSPQEIVTLADRALYSAKLSGRNQVVAASDHVLAAAS